MVSWLIRLPLPYLMKFVRWRRSGSMKISLLLVNFVPVMRVVVLRMESLLIVNLIRVVVLGLPVTIRVVCRLTLLVPVIVTMIRRRWTPLVLVLVRLMV